MARLRSRQKATSESTSQWYKRASAACHSFKFHESHARSPFGGRCVIRRS